MSKEFIHPYELSVWKNELCNELSNPFEVNGGLYNTDNQLLIFHTLTVNKIEWAKTTGNLNELTVQDKFDLTHEKFDIISSGDNSESSYTVGPVKEEMEGITYDEIPDYVREHGIADENHGTIKINEFKNLADALGLTEGQEIKTYKDYYLLPDDLSNLGAAIDPNDIIKGYMHCVYGKKISYGQYQIILEGYPDNPSTTSAYTVNDYDYIGIIIDNIDHPYTKTELQSLNASQFGWYPKYISYYNEKQYCVIGSNTMLADNRARNIILKENINGTHDLSFTLYSNYFDAADNKWVSNPFTSTEILTNETRLRLKRVINGENKWLDFLVKNIEEDSAENTFNYSATDAFITELSKTGFNIELNSTLGNNSGTVTELAEQVMLESDWELDLDNSDIIRQFVDESLYQLGAKEALTAYNPITNETINIIKDSIFFTYYSVINTQNKYFQILYHTSDINISYITDLVEYWIEQEKITSDEGELIKTTCQKGTFVSTEWLAFIDTHSNIAETVKLQWANHNYVIDEDGVIYGEKKDSNEYYGGLVLGDNIQFTITERTDEDYNDITWIINETEYTGYIYKDIVLDRKGARLVRTQRTKQDSLTNQIVYLYNKKLSDNTVGIDTYYGFTRTNYIAPQYIKNYMLNGSEYTTTTGWYVNPSYEASAPEASISISLEEETEGLLKIKKGNNAIYNSAFTNIKDYLTTIGINQQLVIGIKAYTYDEENVLKAITDYSNWSIYIGKYYAAKNQYLPKENSYFTQSEWTKDEAHFTNASILNATEYTKGKYYTYAESTATSNQQYAKANEEFLASTTYYQKNENYYYNILTCNTAITEEDLNNGLIGLFIDMPVGTYYIEEILLHDYNNCILDIVDETTITKERPYLPGEYIPTTIQTKYYYYKPNTYYNVETQIEYDYINTIDSDQYVPIYNNFEKIKSIEAAESNRYNVLQDIAETFECWVDFNINRKSNGEIVLTNWKKVFPTAFSPTTQYFRQDPVYFNTCVPYNIFKSVTKTDKFDKHTNYYIKNATTGCYDYLNIIDGYTDITTQASTYRAAGYEIYIRDDNENYVLYEDEFTDLDIYYVSNYSYELYTRQSLYTIRSVDNSIQFYIYTPCRQNKTIRYKNYIDKEHGLGIKYGLNLKTIERELISDEIVTKLIVSNNSNEYSLNGNKSCSIQNAKSNPTKQNFLLNFDYYINNQLLNKEEVENDLNNYYADIADIYTEIDEYTALKTKYANTKNQLDAQLIVLRTTINNLVEELDEQYDNFGWTDHSADNDSDTLYSFTLETAKIIYNKETPIWADDVTEADKTNIYNEVQKHDDCIADIKSILYNEELQKKTQSSYYELQNQSLATNSQITTLTLNIEDCVQRQNNLNQEFFQKYHDYILEGTWIDEEQMDDELYYLDALGILNTSKSPQVTYNVSMVDLSSLEGYEQYNFTIGDKTYVEDPEFFGYKDDACLIPYQEEVIVSEVEYHLEAPEESVITVKNYKTRFEDLFQRVSASVQSIEYSKGAYNRAAALVSEDGTLKTSILEQSLSNAPMVYVSNDYVTIDNNGVIVKEKDLNKQLKVGPTGIYVTTDGGINWTSVVTSEALNAQMLKTGHIDTSNLQIYANDNIAFRWDSTGINSFSIDNNATNYHKFVRLDQYGIYGIDSHNYEKFESTPNAWDDDNTYYVSNDNSSFTPIHSYSLLKFKDLIYYEILDGEPIPTEDTEPNWEKKYYLEIEGKYELQENKPPIPVKGYDYYDLLTAVWTPDKTSDTSTYQQIKDKAIFGLTYDGFFLKSKHDEGYVEISDQNDIKVKQYNNDSEINRIEIGLLDEWGSSLKVSLTQYTDATELKKLVLNDWNWCTGVDPTSTEEFAPDGSITKFEDDLVYGYFNDDNFLIVEDKTQTPSYMIDYYYYQKWYAEESGTIFDPNKIYYYKSSIVSEETSESDYEYKKVEEGETRDPKIQYYTHATPPSGNIPQFYDSSKYYSESLTNLNHHNLRYENQTATSIEFKYYFYNLNGEFIKSATEFKEITSDTYEVLVETNRQLIEPEELLWIEKTYDAGGQYGIRINDKDGAPVLESTDTGELWLKKLLRIGPDYNNYSLDNAQLGLVTSYNKVTVEGTTVGKVTEWTDYADYTKILSIQGSKGTFFTHSKYIPLEQDTPTDETDVLAIYDDGFILAQNAEIKGTIYADAGKIANFTIETDKLYAENTETENQVTISPELISLGKPNEVSHLPDFYVTNDGFLQAKNVNITGKLTTSVFEKNTTQVAGGSMIFKTAAIVDIKKSEGTLICFKNHEGYENFNIGDRISLVLSTDNRTSSGSSGTEDYYIITSKKIIDDKTLGIIINSAWTKPEDDGEVLCLQLWTNGSVVSDWLIGINSTGLLKPYNLFPNSLTFNEPTWDTESHKVTLSPKVVLGDLSTLDIKQVGEYKPTNGLYAKDVVLNGMLTTTYYDEEYNEQHIAGIGGGSNAHIPEKYHGNILDEKIVSDQSEIIIWGGAIYDDETETYDLPQSNFIVTNKGTILSTQGYFARSVIVDAKISGTRFSNINVVQDNSKPNITIQHSRLASEGLVYIDQQFAKIRDEDISPTRLYEGADIKDLNLYEKSSRFENAFFETGETIYRPELRDKLYWKADGTEIDDHWTRPYLASPKIFSLNTNDATNNGCYIQAFGVPYTKITEEGEELVSDEILIINPTEFKYTGAVTEIHINCGEWTREG